MPTWEYTYVIEELIPVDGGLRRSWFIARPDRAEEPDRMAPNDMLRILGQEGWELVSVIAEASQTTDSPTLAGGVPMGSSRTAHMNVTIKTYYFKRPVGA